MVVAVADGLRLAAQFNPVASGVGAAIAAALLARKTTPLRATLAALVIAAAWVLGDGAVMLAAGSAQSAQGAATATMAAWIVGGVALGFAAPALAGAYVGRRVVFGTGWASAAVVAASVSAAFAALLGRIG